MRITDLLKRESIELNAAVTSKDEAIDKLIGLQINGGCISDAERYKSDILAREESASTAVGDGIAIPHAKSDGVKSPSLAAITVPGGVDYGALDGNPSNLLFMIAAPNDGDVHLEVLSRLMTLLMDAGFRQRLLLAKDKDEFLSVIDAKETEKYPDEPKAAEKPESGYRILAVTACPTGIAHTYMAAEALEKAGEKLGYSIKVETNGSGGAKNVLTKEEIEKADGIIIAADKSVDMARFDGKRLISTKVSDGIKKPEELIQRIIDGDAGIYRYSGEKAKAESSGKDGFGRQIYKHLMNGVSNMLPFVVAGGIFIAIAFLIDTLSGAPQDANFGMNTPAAAFFKTIGNVAFNFMIPILAGYIGKSIADRPGLLVGFVGGYLMLGLEKLCDKMPKALEGIKPVLIYPIVGLGLIAVIMCAVNPFMGMINTGLTNLLNSMGSSSRVVLGCILGGMMAIDMGGPFNKAAYVFGTAAIASGNYDIMAAVMVGGMVPPIAIALAATFAKKKFTKAERKSAPVNYIMGLSFITEGAIPYAASDPLRVIPSCVVGSAVAGGLSMLFNCTLMAPHGGIFVFAVVGNWPLYIVSLLAGSIVGAVMLALLKKRVNE